MELSSKVHEDPGTILVPKINCCSFVGQLIKIHLACDGNAGQTEGIVEA